MTPRARNHELAEIEMQIRRLQRRAQQLMAVNGHGVANGREDMRERRKAPGPPPIVANLWDWPRKRRATS